MQPKIVEYKKLEDGKLAIRLQGKRKFNVINDPEIAAYLIFMLSKGKAEYEHYCANSACKSDKSIDRNGDHWLAVNIKEGRA